MPITTSPNVISSYSYAGGQILRETWELEIIGRWYYLVLLKHKPKFTYGTQGPSFESLP